jgi:hypothetical protein
MIYPTYLKLCYARAEASFVKDPLIPLDNNNVSQYSSASHCDITTSVPNQREQTT